MLVLFCIILLICNYQLDAQVPSTQLLDTIRTVAEKMPRFSGCEEIEGTSRAKKACADLKMLEYIYQEFRFPCCISYEVGTHSCFVVVGFTVNKQGRLQDITLKKSSEIAWLNREALRLVESMNYLPPWTPAQQDGQPVDLRYHLPIRIHLN
jgi:protein TonB